MVITRSNGAQSDVPAEKAAEPAAGMSSERIAPSATQIEARATSSTAAGARRAPTSEGTTTRAASTTAPRIRQPPGNIQKPTAFTIDVGPKTAERPARQATIEETVTETASTPSLMQMTSGPTTDVSGGTAVNQTYRGPVPAPRTRTKSSTSRARKLELLKAKEELLKKEVELAAAKVSLLEAEEDSEEDSLAEDRLDRTQSWVNVQEALALTMEPHQEIQRIEEEPRAPQQEPPDRSARIVEPAPCTAPRPAPAPTVHASQSNGDSLRELAAAITLAARSAQPAITPRPTQELPIFSGASQDWLPFKTAYTETSDSFSDSDNLARLRRCVRGAAKDAVQCLFVGKTVPSEVMRLLESRFGRPDAIVISEMDKLRSLPRLSENPRDICVFASKVSNVIATVRALNKIQYLYNPEVVRQVMEKFPPTLRYRFYDYSAEQCSEDPDLVRLAHFLEKVADRCGAYAPAEQIAGADRRESADRRETAGAPARKRAYATEEKGQDTECTVCGRGRHRESDCGIFKKADVNDRWAMAKKHNLCFRCLKVRRGQHACKERRCNINNCKYSHHSLLHRTVARSNSTTEGEKEKEIAVVTSARNTSKVVTALLKIVPVEVFGPKGSTNTYALLDDGSTCTIIEEAIAHKIGADGPRELLQIEGVAGARINTQSSAKINFKIRGLQGSTRSITARTMKNLKLSPQSIDNGILTDCKHLSDIVNDLVYSYGVPTILIGQDNWHLLLAHATRRGLRSQPVASLTDLGWVLHGAYESRRNRRSHRVSHIVETHTDSMEALMKEHFALESLGVAPKRGLTENERRATAMLEAHTQQVPAGGFETCLLWKEDNTVPPPSYHTALRRLELVEKKLDRDPGLKERYEKQINIFLEKGYAELAPVAAGERVWYLPHFGVTHPEKPEKLRIVHDAAAETKGVSLNSMLLAGPDLIQSLPGVLMRFRQRAVGVTADIQEMFMRIGIRETDRDMQRFLWRGDRRHGPPTEYRMKSVIFGSKSSPCTAIYVKNHNARLHATEHPIAATAIERNHYVDDYIISFDTAQEAIEVSRQVKEINQKGNFFLRGWASNSREVLKEVAPNPNKETVSLDPEKILGMVWRPDEDSLSFNINVNRMPIDLLNGDRTPTKREALKMIMSLYDPLGLATPVTIQGKRILQETWRSGIEWDDELIDRDAATWKRWMEDVRRLQLLAVPRCYAPVTGGRIIELHTFVDASAEVYAAVTYWRITENNETRCKLITGKARVSPVNKVISIPRLELQAAVLGCRLASTAEEEHDWKPSRRVYWSDSKTVLSWIRNGPKVYKPFVAHRLAEIAETTKVSEWRWIPTADNVADDATRDTPRDFDGEHRWYNGPEFLSLDATHWPREEATAPESTGEERVHRIQSKHRLIDSLPLVNRFSSWLRLIRTTARVLQFIDRLRARETCAAAWKRTQAAADSDPTWARVGKKKPAKLHHRPKDNRAVRNYAPLGAELQQRAEHLWVRALQEDSYAEEIAALRKGLPIPTASRLSQLAVDLHDDGVLRLRSRVAAAEGLTAGQSSPPIIDGDNRWTQLYIFWVHKKLNHSGYEATATEVRQHYWVLRLRNATRGVISRCQACRLRRATPAQPSTGNHPPSRLAHHKRAFTFTGTDYFGPMLVSVGRTRQKRYGALFTCLTTRAVHIELAGSLTTDSAVMALRRFISRRGCPSEIWSDQGTNLRGADMELRRAAADAMHTEASVRAIRWRYIPPSAPFMGGAWERLVRSVKTALLTTLHERAPKEEVLATLLTEAEYTVNSRPLTHLSMEPGDEGPLTPNHFLLGGPARVPLPGTFTEEDAAGRREWRVSQRLADMFWARWVREYLPELQHRREPRATGGALRVGDLVLIADGTLPRNCWPRGEIIAVFPGPDGEVRAVDVRTTKGILRRPTKKLAILRVDAS